MRYRRALLVIELDADPRPALSALRDIAPALEHLRAVVHVAAPTFAWLSGEGTPDAAALASVEALREAASAIAPSVEVELAPELSGVAIAELAAAAHVDLLVAGARSRGIASALNEVRKRHALAILFAEREHGRPIRELLSVALGPRARAAIRAFLHEHADPSLHVTLLSSEGPLPDEVAAIRELIGIEAKVEVPPDASLRSLLDVWGPDRSVDLMVFARLPLTLLLGIPWPAPVLLLPPIPSRWLVRRPIDVPDVIDDGGPLRARVDWAAGVGDLPPVAAEKIAFVSKGQVVATILTTRDGEAELPAALGATTLGVLRLAEDGPPDPIAAIEEHIAVLRPTGPLVLFDAELAHDALGPLAALATEVLAVRLRPTRSCRSIRERLRAAGLPAHVVDARAILDEGEALDVSEAIDPVRLARVASALRRAGFPITAIVHRGPIQPSARGFTALRATELASGPAEVAPAPADVAPLEPLAGNRIELELDNTTARRWLLEAIASAAESVSLQVYMAADDDVGRQVEAALAAAGGRGVKVRVLVDSLHGLHGSFGIRNPLLARLGAHGGVELVIARPITELPSLADLKARDHRKLVVVDGRVALLGGRNLAHEYYTGFEEVRLTAETPWREVPWLDAGARVEGPVVATLARTFLDAWIAAGGAPFELGAPPPPVGATAARVVIHRGLRDARALETYLELIESARSHVDAVNGFPLVLELQHALLRAVRRGIRVRWLIGHVTPTHGGEPFKGPWAAARTAATELVHSRADALVDAGGEAYALAVRDVPGWAPELGVVHPHVHAKVMSVDGRRCAVGSANLDITSAYWESELMLVIEDAAVTARLEAAIDARIAGSLRLERDDPARRRLAARRAWMRHWPGVLSI